jgi:hypothetical protein
MSIVQISKIQQRRGLEQDLPNLDSAEMGWSIDTRKLYIGNGKLAEGAPLEGKTEVLTEYSILDFTSGLVGNVLALESNVAILQSNVVVINSQILALQAGTTTSNVSILPSSSSGTIVPIYANNAVISYTLNQGSDIRSGTLSFTRSGSTVVTDEEYTQTSSSIDAVLTMDASTGVRADLKYTTVTASTILYRIQSLT